MSVLERCPSYRESNKRSKERQGPTLSVRFTEVSVKRESTVVKIPITEKKKPSQADKQALYINQRRSLTRNRFEYRFEKFLKNR